MRDLEKATALHNAASIGSAECLDFIIQGLQKNPSLAFDDSSDPENANKEPIAFVLNIKDELGLTALHQSAMTGATECVRLLLDAGADYSLVDNVGCNCLHYASFYGFRDCIELLASRHLQNIGASQASEDDSFINGKDNLGATALHKVSYQGHVDCLSLMIDFGAALGSKDRNGATALHVASLKNREKSVRLLIERGIDTNDPDTEGETALHKAAYLGNDETVEALVQSNAKTDARDLTGVTALHNAAIKGHVGCLYKLLSPETANLVDNDGNSPLHFAAARGKTEVVQFFLSNKDDMNIDINMLNAANESPLFLAIKSNNEDLTRELVLEGADAHDANVLKLSQQEGSRISTALLDSFEGERERRRRVKDSMDPAVKAKLRRCIALFNTKPFKGLKQLQEEGLLGTSPKEIAEFFHTQERLNKEALGEILGDPGYPEIRHAFVDYLDFKGLNFELALRHYLNTFRLPGEAQKIDRLMEAFAQKFYESCEEGIFASADAAYVLSFSVIMLNTDAHNPAIKKQNRMTRQQFVGNNRGCNDGEDFPREYLEYIYDRIVQEEIKMNMDAVEAVFHNAEKKGYLTKQGGRVKTWKRRWFALTNNCLYYFKSEQDEKNPCGWIPLENLQITPVITKNKFTMIIQPAIPGAQIKSCKMDDGRVVPGSHSRFIISAATQEELNSWMDAINSGMQKNPLLQLVQGRLDQKSKAIRK